MRIGDTSQGNGYRFYLTAIVSGLLALGVTVGRTQRRSKCGNTISVHVAQAFRRLGPGQFNSNSPLTTISEPFAVCACRPFDLVYKDISALWV